MTEPVQHVVVEPSDPTKATTEFMLRIAHQHERLVEEQLARISAEGHGAVIEAKAEREGILATLGQRINDMDKANEILATNVNRTPTLLQTATRTLTELEDVKLNGIRELFAARFGAVDQRFTDLAARTTEDKRVAQEALVAALAAAKELVGKQNEFSAAAIGKSEANTTTTIEQNRQLADANFAGLARQVTDLKDAVTLWRQDIAATLSSVRAEIIAMQASRIGAHDQLADQRAGIEAKRQANMVLIASVALIATIIIGALGFYVGSR